MKKDVIYNRVSRGKKKEDPQTFFSRKGCLRWKKNIYGLLNEVEMDLETYEAIELSEKEKESYKRSVYTDRKYK